MSRRAGPGGPVRGPRREGGGGPEGRRSDAHAPFDACALPPGSPRLPLVEDGPLRRPVLDASSVEALARALRDAREGLLALSSVQRADGLGRAGRRFLDAGDPLRREAEARLPATAGVSPAMAREVIEGMARDWTPERLRELLAADLGEPSPLDAWVEGRGGRRVRATGHPLTLHVGAGTVPGVSATSALRALLVGSAAILKPGRGDVVLPVLLARALAEEAPPLAAALAVLYWPGGESPDAEAAALSAADLVVAYGGDETLADLRGRLPAHVGLVAYHHRVSVAVVGREALAPGRMEAAAADAARAVAVFDQRGCVSPHVVWVEEGGAATPEAFAAAVAGELERLHETLPPGPADAREAAALHQIRGTAELRAAAGQGVRVWSGGAAPWTVVLDPEPGFEPSCLNRTVRVKPVTDAGGVAGLLAPLRPWLQTVGVAGLGDRIEAVAASLARAGAVRVAPLEASPWPPPWWHHDGRGPLDALVRWTDLEE
ncbi:MAG: hypothetical protein KY453_05405 [Gemmatimonadetes bacterium]|nr:hypothetical protein [Gemmatimonadota bacterium]